LTGFTSRGTAAVDATERATNPGEVGSTLAGGAPGRAGIMLAARVMAADAGDGGDCTLITVVGMLATAGGGIDVVKDFPGRLSSSPSSKLITSSSSPPGE